MVHVRPPFRNECDGVRFTSGVQLKFFVYAVAPKFDSEIDMDDEERAYYSIELEHWMNKESHQRYIKVRLFGFAFGKLISCVLSIEANKIANRISLIMMQSSHDSSHWSDTATMTKNR